MEVKSVDQNFRQRIGIFFLMVWLGLLLGFNLTFSWLQ